ncbi:MAG TPA: TonB-dependent receptor plug domain-containing protein [Flavobacteriales bacterium]|nr:TonB-dependent receptor plug domain-containing protein [Flavobacteriales bacterium]
MRGSIMFTLFGFCTNATVLIILFLSLSTQALAQEPDTTKKDTLDFYDMSLEQLLTLKAHGVPTEMEALLNSLISVASKKPLSARESPSIITQVTEEEIRNSGARDLIDVLRLVPGLDFGVDVEGVVGIGVRGNWAHEGKVLLLIDGQEMNEIMFATTQFGNHYPVDQIKKIEIIRGPGSAIYGGFAEFGVINIVTRQGGDINGVSLSGIYGQMENDFGHRNVNLAVGQKIKDFEYSIQGTIGEGNRSDQDYTDFDSTTHNMGNGNSKLDPKFFNVGMSWKGLSFRGIGDFYRTTQQDAYGVSAPISYAETYYSKFFELKYAWKLNDKFTLTPRVNFKQQTPWSTQPIDSVVEAFIKTANRMTGNLTASYNINRYVNVVFGGEAFQDIAKDEVDSSFFSNGESTVTYFNYAFFTQGLVKTRLVNIILGARYDKHNVYGDAFVPRVGFTKKFTKFHFKALYSNAFRAPSIENINAAYNGEIKPEKTQVIEVEAGYQVTRKSFLTLNFYDITTKDPIVYYYDTVNLADTYTNFGESGTRGIEAEYRVKQRWGYVTLNYAFYTVEGKKSIEDYAIPDDESALLAFANHRVNLNACFNVGKMLSISPTVSFYGPRYGYTHQDTTYTSVVEKLPATTLINLFIKFTPVKGVSLGFGVYDLLNEKFRFIQPYNGYHAPLPGPSREFIFRAQFDLNFKSDKKKEERK